MNVIYPELVDPYDRSLLERATKLLEETINKNSSGFPAINTTSGGPPTIGTPRNVTATWSTQKTEHGSYIYVLKLSDPVGEVTTEFYPSDLRDQASPPLLPYRMARLWGDILQKHSRKQFEELIKARQE